MTNGRITRTLGPGTAVSAVESASQATIRAISWTSAFVSRELVVLDRSWLSLARRLGCCETWTLGGSDEAMMDYWYGILLSTG